MNTPAVATKGAEPPKKPCFVIAPIGEEGSEVRKKSDAVLEYLIKRPLKPIGYIAERADEIHQPGLITLQVLERVISAELVVADLSGRNPNVFYELAIRDATQKAFVLLYDKDEEEPLPFDVAQMRAVPYSYSDKALWEQAKETIVHHVEAIKRNEPCHTILNQTLLTMSAQDGSSTDETLAEILRILSSIQADMLRDKHAESLRTAEQKAYGGRSLKHLGPRTAPPGIAGIRRPTSFKP